VRQENGSSACSSRRGGRPRPGSRPCAGGGSRRRWSRPIDVSHRKARRASRLRSVRRRRGAR
jgi:hypothetical protein